jgi:enoyl-CoA hydratase/carnithine racemase
MQRPSYHGRVSESLELQTRGGVTILTLNRPQVRNAVDAEMRSALRDALLRVAQDPAVRGLVLTGAGTAFCSGGDVRGMQARGGDGAAVAEAGWRRQHELHRILSSLYFLDRPTVAAVNGPAFGLGLDLALCCDFIFASERATFSAGFVHRGLVPDGGGMFFLPRRIGLARAKDMIFSGRTVQADEALAIGLADRVVAPERLLDETTAYLDQLAQLPRPAQALAKDILNRTFELSLDEINALGAQAQAICYTTPEHADAVSAFLNRRA